MHHLVYILLDPSQGNHWFQIRKSTYIEVYFGYQHDNIRVDAVYPEDLHKAARKMKPWLPSASQDTLHLIFYHLDESVISSFKSPDIQAVIRLFGGGISVP